MLSNTISVGRKSLARSYQRVNVLLARMLRRYAHASLVDVTSPTLDRRGRPRNELFRSDSIHLNPKGYVVWTAALRPVLVPADTAKASQGKK